MAGSPVFLPSYIVAGISTHHRTVQKQISNAITSFKKLKENNC
ncbi:hypothetical protein ACFSKL_16265 [Belliella marina]|uniref:Uncharacterized protein n=1 Tax=Belliella marina TaxID=1644146 RepID=A0ABW4VU23_9BACT